MAFGGRRSQGLGAVAPPGPLVFLLNAVEMTLASVTFGFALYLLWGWFVVPAFGVAALSYGHSVGLTLCARGLTGGMVRSDDWADALLRFWMPLLQCTVGIPVILISVGAIIRLSGSLLG